MHALIYKPQVTTQCSNLGTKKENSVISIDIKLTFFRGSRLSDAGVRTGTDEPERRSMLVLAKVLGGACLWVPGTPPLISVPACQAIFCEVLFPGICMLAYIVYDPLEYSALRLYTVNVRFSSLKTMYKVSTHENLITFI